jgi:hypothetical protein
MGTNVFDPPYFKPPTVATPFPGNITSGQILLFKDANWGSDSLTIDTTSSAYPEGYPFSFAGTALDSQATWVVFDLPAGVVCTLFDNPISPPSSSTPFSLEGAGVCVDLIGNGSVQTVDLYNYGANDRMSAGIWRHVDKDAGWFQLFRDTDNKASFVTIFLAEWPAATANSLSGWDINSQASSINYPSLTPPQVLTLSANADGSGQAVTLGAANPFGTFTTTPVTVNFTDRGMNDKIQSFAYNFYVPVMGIIQSSMPDSNLTLVNGQTVEDSINGQNNSSQPVQVATNVFQNVAYTVTNKTTLQYSSTVAVTAEASFTLSLSENLGIGGKLTVAYTYMTSTTTTQTFTNTQTFQAGQTITFSAPAESSYSATASISIGTLPPTQVTTTGTFYYTQDLPGSVLDPITKYFMLTMPIVTTLNGLIGTQLTFQVSETPIVSSSALASQSAKRARRKRRQRG